MNKFWKAEECVYGFYFFLTGGEEVLENEVCS